MPGMTCREFYFYAVALAFLGGFAFAAVALIFRKFAQRPTEKALADGELRRHNDDAKLVMYLSLLPQGLLLSLPVIYPDSPGQVPESLAETAVMTSASLLVLWGWAIISFCRGGLIQLTKTGWSETLPTWLPGIMSALTILASYVRVRI